MRHRLSVGPLMAHTARQLSTLALLYAGNVIQFARSSRRRDIPCLEGFDRTRNPIDAQAMCTSSLVARQVANFRARSFDAQFFMPGDDLRRDNAEAMPRRASLCHFPDTADDDSPLALFDSIVRAIRRSIISAGQETAAPDFGRPHEASPAPAPTYVREHGGGDDA